jgi:hypothetical protein
MQKMWRKQRCRDIMVINHRHQGLAEKICKTHRIELAKRINFRVRSEKYRVGFMCEMWDFCRGFPQKVQDTKELKRLKDYTGI